MRGIYGAPTERLSANALLPRLALAERTHGSVTLGMARSLAFGRPANHQDRRVIPVN